jgi:hypothetical protein
MRNSASRVMQAVSTPTSTAAAAQTAACWSGGLVVTAMAEQPACHREPTTGFVGAGNLWRNYSPVGTKRRDGFESCSAGERRAVRI